MQRLQANGVAISHSIAEFVFMQGNSLVDMRCVMMMLVLVRRRVGTVVVQGMGIVVVLMVVQSMGIVVVQSMGIVVVLMVVQRFRADGITIGHSISQLVLMERAFNASSICLLIPMKVFMQRFWTDHVTIRHPIPQLVLIEISLVYIQRVKLIFSFALEPVLWLAFHRRKYRFTFFNPPFVESLGHRSLFSTKLNRGSIDLDVHLGWWRVLDG